MALITSLPLGSRERVIVLLDGSRLHEELGSQNYAGLHRASPAVEAQVEPQAMMQDNVQRMRLHKRQLNSLVITNH